MTIQELKLAIDDIINDYIDKSDTECVGGVVYYNFSQALRKLKNKQKVARKYWNDNYQYIELQKLKTRDNPSEKEYIFAKTNNNELILWGATQQDILGYDWYVVD